ncbi:hypothetical protein RB298_04890 [Priestia sp. BR_2]
MNDNNAESSISLMAAVIWFVAALSIGLTSYVLQEKSIEAVAIANANEDRRVQTLYKIEANETYSGAQVIQTLYEINKIEADIEVNHLFFSKNINIESTDVSGIDPYKNYIVTFERNTEGKLQKIIFRG